MGYAISWLAARSNTELPLLLSLGLEKTGIVEDEPDSKWSCTTAGEWVVVWCNSFEPAKFRDAGSKLGGEVVICHVEEHVMYVSAAAFKEGAMTWHIVHDAQLGSEHLSVEGVPPDSFARIRAEEIAHASADTEVDFIFEIPVRIAKEVVGFRHDESSSSEWNALKEMSRSKSKWKLW